MKIIERSARSDRVFLRFGLALASLATGCADHAATEGDARATAAAARGPALISSAATARLASLGGVWTDLGRASESPAEGLARVATPDGDRAGAVMFDLAADRAYRLSVPGAALAESGRLRRAAAAQGRQTAIGGRITTPLTIEPASGQPPASRPLTLIGPDDRVPIGIAERGLETPFRRIGKLQGVGACTGTLVGGRTEITPNQWVYYVATAAHCIVTALGKIKTGIKFYPRLDDCVGVTEPCNGQPYGEWNRVGAALVPEEYMSRACYDLAFTYTNVCVASDTAIIMVQLPEGVSNPGFLPFKYKDSIALNALSLRVFGYPGCGGTGDPSPNCRPNTLYGQLGFDCPVGGFGRLDGNNQPRFGLHGCDTSHGQSGSAIIGNDPSGGWTVFGTHSAGDTLPNPGPLPNSFRVNTQEWVDLFEAVADL